MIYINWKKIALVTADIALGCYIAFAITAFNKPDESNRLCTKVSIDIQDESANGFLDTQEIKKRLERLRLYPLGKQLNTINVRSIEESLKASPFVKTAECFKTQDGHVTIYLTQRMPTVRIKAINGDDYYLDDNNQVMPNSHYTSDLIVATGYISRKYAKQYISHFVNTLMGNDFWRNQTEQVNVLHDKSIELVPRVGSHIVHLGPLPESSDPSMRKKMIEDFTTKKMTRLEKFYKYGLSQVGWNKYNYINLEFDNQIICKKHNATDNDNN